MPDETKRMREWSDADLAANVRIMVGLARAEINRLCAGRGQMQGGIAGREWTMCVPAREDDSDFIFGRLASMADELAIRALVSRVSPPAAGTPSHHTESPMSTQLPTIEPTPEMLASPEFEAVWQAIKKWDISRLPFAETDMPHRMYSGATGSDVATILNALGWKPPAAGTGEDAARLSAIREHAIAGIASSHAGMHDRLHAILDLVPESAGE